MRKTIIGIMGPGISASKADMQVASKLGAAIAGNGWVTLTGGRPVGIMEAALKGAAEEGGLTLGILPGEEPGSEYIDISIKTGLGNARNSINILTADVIVAIGMGPGTASEVALAIKSGKPTILVNPTVATLTFFGNLYPGIVRTIGVPDTIEAINEALES